MSQELTPGYFERQVTATELTLARKNASSFPVNGTVSHCPPLTESSTPGAIHGVSREHMACSQLEPIPGLVLSKMRYSEPLLLNSDRERKAACTVQTRL